MKIISWNLLHTSGATLEQVERLIAQHHPDIMLMQEATSRIDNLQKNIGGYYGRMVLPGRHHGLAAWSRLPFQSPEMSLKLQRGIMVRRIAQILYLEGITIANVHLSHGQFLNRLQLQQIIRVLPARAAILGDCNMIGAPLLHGFDDVGPRQSTHHSARLFPLRLDRCFVKNLQCTAASALEHYSSDHRPIMVVLA